MDEPCLDISEACEEGAIEEVERLIRAGVDVNKKEFYGWTPIHRAVISGHTDIVKLLLEHGANIDEKDNDGRTPINRVMEAWQRHPDIVKLLLDHGANIHLKDKHGRSPIHLTAREGHTDTMKLLLEYGADIDEKGNNGWTPIHQAAYRGHTDTVKLLLSAGADPHISGYRTVRDLLKRGWSEEWEEKILSSYSSKENYNAYIAAAVALNKDDFLMKFISKVSEKKGTLVDSFLTRDVEDISHLLVFIDRHITRDERGGNTTDPNIKMLIGGEGENRFYLVKTKALRDKSGDKSLLQYIVDNGARMMKQREELFDLLVEKIENVNSWSWLHGKDFESKIIHNLKLGLPSSIGLAECIKMTEEKFPWSKMKAGGMIALSIIVNLVSLALYFVDVITDGQFADDMFTNSMKNYKDFKVLQANCTEEFYREMEDGKWRRLCEEKKEYCFKLHENLTLIGQRCRDFELRFEDPHRFKECFWYSLIHCIAPVIWTIVVFTKTVPMKVSNFLRIPFPPITRVVNIHKDTQKFKMRCRTEFKEKVPELEADIANYQDSVNLSSSIEAATEASPQFFFQTVYFLPNLILKLSVSYYKLSIVFSFTSVAVSNYLIR